MKTIRLHDKTFGLYISAGHIQTAVRDLARKMDFELEGKNPLFIAVLNGSFMFAADLLRAMQTEGEISFIKLASYEGTRSTGEVKSLIGLNTPLKDRTVVILEDIVDTGNTLKSMLLQLENEKPSRILTATMLFKRDAFRLEIEPEFVALEVPDLFLVGYGLDYDGAGRNFPDIYAEM